MIQINPSNRISEVKTYYFATKLQQIANMNDEGKQVINLGIGNPDLAPPLSVISTLQTVSSEAINGYQSYTGIPELKKAIKNWYQKIYQIETGENVLPLMGSKEGIFHISQAFLNPGDKVLIPNPGYPAYAANAKIAGAEIIHYDLTAASNWYPDFDQLERLVDEKTKILWCNYPNMPTGKPADQNVFRQLIDFGIKHNVIIVHDNPYSFVLNEKPQSIFQNSEAWQTCIELNSLSKSHHIAGWRIGMMLADQSIIQSVLKVKTNIDSGMYKGLQLAAVEALKTELAWHAQQNEIYQQRKALITQMMNILKCEVLEGGQGLFVWAKIPAEKQSAETYSDEILNASNVFITPGFIFGSNGDRYLRASLCAKETQIEEAIKRIKEKLQ